MNCILPTCQNKRRMSDAWTTNLSKLARQGDWLWLAHTLQVANLSEPAPHGSENKGRRSINCGVRGSQGKFKEHRMMMSNDEPGSVANTGPMVSKYSRYKSFPDNRVLVRTPCRYLLWHVKRIRLRPKLISLVLIGGRLRWCVQRRGPWLPRGMRRSRCKKG